MDLLFHSWIRTMAPASDHNFAACQYNNNMPINWFLPLCLAPHTAFISSSSPSTMEDRSCGVDIHIHCVILWISLPINWFCFVLQSNKCSFLSCYPHQLVSRWTYILPHSIIKQKWRCFIHNENLKLWIKHNSNQNKRL